MPDVTPPLNPDTGQPYFSIPVSGWGEGWKAGPRFTGKLSDLQAQFRDRNELFDDTLARVRDAVGHQTEQEITAALTRVLGERWTPEALAGRTHSEHEAATGNMTYYLDGRPLVRIGAPKFSQIDQHLHYTLPVERFA